MNSLLISERGVTRGTSAVDDRPPSLQRRTPCNATCHPFTKSSPTGRAVRQLGNDVAPECELDEQDRTRVRETPARSHSVLIVDDAAASRDLLRWQLGRDSQLRVIGEAVDGAEALDRAAELRPDLIVLDLDMPGRDGLSVLPQLYAAAPGTRVVVLTGHSSVNAFSAARDLGAVGCLRKGLRRIDLLHALHEALRQRP